MKHILIDYENIHPTAEQLNNLDKACCIWLFLGANQQKNISVDLAEALCHFEKVEFIRIERIGKNALDFYLAYYLGKITEIDDEAIICILSKDNGYDVLVEHLQNQTKPHQIIRLGKIDTTFHEHHQISSQGSHLIEESALIERDTAQKGNEFSSISSQCFRKVSQYLITPNVFKPCQLNNLTSGISNRLLADELSVYSESDRKLIIQKVIERLCRNQLIVVNGKLVTYQTSAKDIRNLFINQLIKAKPNSITSAKNVLRSKAKQLGFEEDEAVIEKLLQYCQSQQLFKQKNNKLVYPPFPVPTPTMDKKEAEIMEKINDRLFKPNVKNKPSSLKAMKNMLKASFKLPDSDIERLVSLLSESGKISISATDRISY